VKNRPKTALTPAEEQDLASLKQHLSEVGYIVADFETLLEHGLYRGYQHLHNQVISLNLCQGIETGNAWLARSGRAWSCNFGTHENIIKRMGLDTKGLEAAGWIRVSICPGQSGDIKGVYKPSPKQRRAITDMGLSWRLKELFWRTAPRLPIEAPIISIWE